MSLGSLARRVVMNEMQLENTPFIYDLFMFRPESIQFRGRDCVVVQFRISQIGDRPIYCETPNGFDIYRLDE